MVTICDNCGSSTDVQRFKLRGAERFRGGNFAGEFCKKCRKEIIKVLKKYGFDWYPLSMSLWW
jgi:hypothetical protein